MNELARERFWQLAYAATPADVAQAAASGAARTPASEAVVHVYCLDGQSDQGRPGDGGGFRFRAYGDPATLACADWLCEQASADLPAARALTPGALAEVLG